MSLLGTVLLGVQGLLGLAMVAAAGSKAFAESQVEAFEHYGYPQWFRLVTGGVELVAGISLLAGLVVTPTLALGGGLLTAAVMTGAVLTHVRIGDPVRVMAIPASILVVALVVIWNQAGALA